MTDFNKTRWADEEFAQQYRDNADIYIVERQRMFGVMQSCIRQYFPGRSDIKVLDLGCGDGIVTSRVLDVAGSASVTLVDASDTMLSKASKRLKNVGNTDYVQASFQEIISNGLPERGYDLVVSSMAIHHLCMEEKEEFFRAVHAHMRPGGHFINIDVVLPPTPELDGWYMKLWEEWMDEKRAELNAYDQASADVIVSYKSGEENQPDTIEDQLDALRAVGFRDADCYYKYGIFVVYGGVKERVAERMFFPDI